MCTSGLGVHTYLWIRGCVCTFGLGAHTPLDWGYVRTPACGFIPVLRFAAQLPKARVPRAAGEPMGSFRSWDLHATTSIPLHGLGRERSPGAPGRPSHWLQCQRCFPAVLAGSGVHSRALVGLVLWAAQGRRGAGFSVCNV